MKKHLDTLKSSWVKVARRSRLEHIFLVLFLLAGAGFIFITPPGQNPDEPSHVFRIWQLSRGNILSDVETAQGAKVIGGQVPDDLMSFFSISKASDPKANHDPNFKFTDIDFNRLSSVYIDEDTQTPQQFPGAALYSPVAYAPTVPVMAAGNALNLPFVYTFYFMRITSLILVGVLLFLSIRHIPVGKWIIFSVGLLPSTVSQAAAITADSLTIGGAFLLTAYVLKLALSRHRISYRNMLALFVLTTAVALTKVTYAPLAAMVLLIPLLNPLARKLADIARVIIPVVLAALLALMWLLLTSYIDQNANPQANIQQQAAFVLTDPLLFIKALHYTFFTRESLSLVGFFGYFGWLTAPIADIYITMLCVALTLAVVVKSPREQTLYHLSTRGRLAWRAVLLSVFMAILLAIALSLYLYFTPPQQSLIMGIQGRYFLPIAPLLMLAFYGNNLKNQSSAKIFIIILITSSLIGGLLTAYARYYQSLPPTLT